MQSTTSASVLRFAITASTNSAAAFAELRSIIVRAGGPDVEPLYLPSYAALYETMCAGLCQLAWAPPLVARDLVRVDAAQPIAATVRSGGDAYYSALLVKSSSPIGHTGQISGSRIGWVSKLSAAGYVVPRYYLQSLGMSLEGLFLSESFHGTHGKLGGALAAGEVDVAATYAALRAGSFVPAAVKTQVRILATAGPIPGDVIVASSRVDEPTLRMLSQSLPRCQFPEGGPLAQLLGVERLVPALPGHLAPLERWTTRAAHGSLRPLTRTDDKTKSHAR